VSGLNVRWVSPGPVSSRFLACGERIKAICGPVGSGKTTTNLMDHVARACKQKPSPRKRVQGLPARLYKLCVVRDTYRNLWRSVLPSWFKRVPRETGEFVGSENAPARHIVTFAPGDGTAVVFWVDFVAMGDMGAEEALGGYEPSAFYLNEAPNLSPDVFTFANSRVGRYPDMEDGGPSWHGITLDMNSPEMGNWCFDGIPESPFDGFFGKLPEGWAFFQQPSGLSPLAENLANLPPGYYRDQMAGAAKWYIERFIHCRPGYSRDGLPVFPEFDDTRHVAAEPLLVMPRRQVIVGLDAGLSPAATVNQVTPSGQWQLQGELVCEPGVGPERFAERLNQYLAEHYPAHLRIRRRPGEPPSIQGWADPSSAYGGDKTHDADRAWLTKVSDKSGIRILPAPTNNLTKRLSAVRVPLTRTIDTEPGFVMSPNLSVCRKALNAGYRFKQVKVGGVRKNLAEIDKNAFSHPMDALQYACLGGGADFDAETRRERETGGPRQTIADNEDHPGGEFEQGGRR
jgi:hypothetical protein